MGVDVSVLQGKLVAGAVEVVLGGRGPADSASVVLPSSLSTWFGVHDSVERSEGGEQLGGMVTWIS